MLKYHFIIFFISIVFLFLMFCTEELKMGNVSRFLRFIFHDGGYIYLALIIVINAFSRNVLEQKFNKKIKNLNTINSRLRKVLPRIVMPEAKHVTKRISLILLVKFSREEVILVNNKKITHV